jgi:hypothetical protein
MKSTELKVGRSYELETGQECTIQQIAGDGRNRAVRVDCLVRLTPSGPFMRWIKSARFAACVKRELAARS